MDVWSQDVRTKDGSKRIERAKGVLDIATEDIRELKGNLRFPLDSTYHGCLPLFGDQSQRGEKSNRKSQ